MERNGDAEPIDRSIFSAHASYNMLGIGDAAFVLLLEFLNSGWDLHLIRPGDGECRPRNLYT